MRLAVGTLALLLGQSLALAEEAPPAPAQIESADARPTAAPAPMKRAKVPLRVVRILKETNQALIFDRTGGGTHLLVGVGEKVGGYTIEAIDEDEVTLSAGDRQIVLAAPDRSWRRRRGGDPEDARGAGRTARVEPAPADPYTATVIEKSEPVDPYAAPESKPAGRPSGGAGTAPAGDTPVDPYADEVREVREVKAPSAVGPAVEIVRSTSADGAGAPGAPPAVVPAPAVVIGPAPTPPIVVAPAPAPAPVSSPAPAVIGPAPAVIGPAPAAVGPAPAVAPDPVLARREIDAALADFGALATAFRASFTPAGVQVEAIAEGSVFAKAGLRAGDVIASVDGRPLRSLDDVAALYARAAGLHVVTAQVLRGGRPIALRVTIQ